MNEEGQPLVPSKGDLFHLAAVVGVTPEQEALLRRMPLGGEGLLAPIFHHGIPVRVADALALVRLPEVATTVGPAETRTVSKASAKQAAFDYAHGQLAKEELRSLGVPRGHPVVRSFLGAPLLDHVGQVRGGLLLGHSEPDRFTEEDETLLVGLAAQAAVALENARLYRMAQMRAQQLDRLFESIGDGVTLVDSQGNIVRENGAARRVREQLKDTPEGQRVMAALLRGPARQVLSGEAIQDISISIGNGQQEAREYLVTASPLHPPPRPSGSLVPVSEATHPAQNGVSGAVVVWHDVTERQLREAERQARVHAKQLETIFETMTDGVFVYDSNGSIVQTNTTARTLFALDIDPEYASRPLEERLARLVVHDTQGQPLPREHFPQVRLLKGEVLAGHNAMEVLVQALDGREFQVNIGGAPLYDQHGRIIGAVMTVRDMSERYRLERRLQEAERAARERASQLEAIFEAVTDAVLVYDGEGQIVQMNKAAHQLMKRLLLSDYATYVTRSLKERVAQVAASDEQGHPLPIEQSPPSRILAGEVLTPDNTADIVLWGINGQFVHLSITGGPLRDAQGQITGAVTVSHDVTERRRLEQIERQMHAETEARRALLQLILDELPSSVYLVRGLDARLVLANHASTAMWGAQWPDDQPMNEFLAQYGIRIFGANGRPLEPSQLATLRAAQQGETVRQHLESIRLPDGTTLPVLVNAVALDGHQLHVLAAQTAVGPREEAEPAAIVVQQDVTALKEAERLKDEFIAIAAHELRNPLAALKGYAQMLVLQTARGKGPPLADWQQEAIEGIDRSTLRLVDLTGDLLDVTRLQAGEFALHLEPTDLVAWVRRIVKRLQVTTEQHTFSIATSVEYLVVPVDPGRMEQVLSNLIGNAIKYSPHGGSIEFTIGEDVQRNEALLSIRDCGIGFRSRSRLASSDALRGQRMREPRALVARV